MSLSLIIFDCDGIILESVDVKTQAFLSLGNTISKEAGDMLVMYHKQHGGVSRFVKFDWLYQSLFGRNTTPEEAEKLNTDYTNFCLDQVYSSQLVPGVLDVLDAWVDKVPMYVASGAPQAELVEILTAKGLAHYFKGIYGSPPAKTQLLQKILAETNISPSLTVMVGDSVTDQYAAEATGCLFYGRGKTFASTNYPWYTDLTKLNNYLETLAKS